MSLANENEKYVGQVVAAKADSNTLTYLASGELVDTRELARLYPDVKLVVREVYTPQAFDLKTRKLVPSGRPVEVATYAANDVTTDRDDCPNELLLLKDFGSSSGPSREYLELTEPGWDK